MTITITDINAVLGVVFGVTGLVLGSMGYLRDKPKVFVELQWDMQLAENGQLSNKYVGIVTVSNIGRRPIFLSHVALKLPKYLEWSHMVLTEGIHGVKLAEGDSPQRFTINHDEMLEKLADDVKKHPNIWKKIKAEISDSAGKKYYSKKIRKEPLWSEQLKSNN